MSEEKCEVWRYLKVELLWEFRLGFMVCSVRVCR